MAFFSSIEVGEKEKWIFFLWIGIAFGETGMVQLFLEPIYILMLDLEEG